jgi:hypothetical protein
MGIAQAGRVVASGGNLVIAGRRVGGLAVGGRTIWRGPAPPPPFSFAPGDFASSAAAVDGLSGSFYTTGPIWTAPANGTVTKLHLTMTALGSGSAHIFSGPGDNVFGDDFGMNAGNSANLNVLRDFVPGASPAFEVETGEWIALAVYTVGDFAGFLDIEFTPAEAESEPWLTSWTEIGPSVGHPDELGVRFNPTEEFTITAIGMWGTTGQPSQIEVFLSEPPGPLDTVNHTPVSGGTVVRQANVDITSGQFNYAEITPLQVVVGKLYLLYFNNAGGDASVGGNPIVHANIASFFGVYGYGGGMIQSSGSPNFGPMNFMFQRPEPPEPPEPPELEGLPAISASDLTNVRGDYVGILATRFTILSDENVVVTALGRWVHTGEPTTSSTVRLLTGEYLWNQLGAVTVEHTTEEEFNYAPLATPVTLAAHGNYTIAFNVASGSLFTNTGTLTSDLVGSFQAFQGIEVGAPLEEIGGTAFYGPVGFLFEQGELGEPPSNVGTNLIPNWNFGSWNGDGPHTGDETNFAYQWNIGFSATAGNMLSVSRYAIPSGELAAITTPGITEAAECTFTTVTGGANYLWQWLETYNVVGGFFPGNINRWFVSCWAKADKPLYLHIGNSFFDSGYQGIGSQWIVRNVGTQWTRIWGVMTYPGLSGTPFASQPTINFNPAGHEQSGTITVTGFEFRAVL